jgi:hypothetical protein
MQNKNRPSTRNDPQEKETVHEIKRAKKGSGPETTKGARKRIEIGLSKGLNRGGANGTAHNGEVKPREPQ